MYKCLYCSKEFKGYKHRVSKYCSRECCGAFKKGKSLWPNGRSMPWMKGASNPLWKGNEVSKDGLHKRVYSARGNPKKCEHCGRKNEKIKNRWYVHWANKSRKYKIDVMDFIALCVPCHRKYDNSYYNLHAHLRPTHESTDQKQKI